MATTSKEGSRRANYPILTRGGSDNTYRCGAARRCNWNEDNSNLLARIDWRASLVPAAAVISAPIAYIKVVAVKKLVVGCGVPGGWSWKRGWTFGAFFWVGQLRASVLLCLCVIHPITVKKLECSRQP